MTYNVFSGTLNPTHSLTHIAPNVKYQRLLVPAVWLIMVALWNRADHYIFILWFLLLSIYLFFASPNLSRRRLDVCHTSAHGVALVRI